MNTDSHLAAPAAGAPLPPAGWYPDPVRGGRGWRWWNGSAWTTFTESTYEGSHPKRPRLPRWLSWPVVWCAPAVVLGVGVLAVVDPLSVGAGFVPLAIVLPVVAWFDRVEPEPRASRAHALLWGASVAIIVAGVLNTLVAVAGGDTLALVLAAPLGEEAMKGLGVVWAVRRCEVDSVTDGVVYAAWVALGFAVIEDISYFAIASEEGSLALVFVLRALLMPFAHPLFTVWIGLAIGRTVQAGRPLWPAALWGYALAVATHMGWNGALAIGDITGEYDERVAATVVLGAVALFLVLFVVVAVALVKMRGREQRRFIAAVPGLVLRYNVAPDEAAVFSSWRRLLRERRMLPRDVRPQFDAVHANLARLALLHDRPGGVDPHAEQVLAKHLGDARAALRTRRSVSR